MPDVQGDTISPAQTTPEGITAMLAIEGNTYPNDTVAIAAMVGVGGRFRAEPQHEQHEYEVMALPDPERLTQPHSVLVRETRQGFLEGMTYPIVRDLHGATHLVATYVNLVVGSDRRDQETRTMERPADNVECGNCSNDYASHRERRHHCPDGYSSMFRAWGSNIELAELPDSAPVTDAEDTADSATIEPRPILPGQVIPRTMDEYRGMRATAEAMRELFPDSTNMTAYIRAIDELSEWLQDGKKQRAGHALAGCDDGDVQQALEDETGVESINLCGEYEAIVCPVLGWMPRRGSANSRMRLTEAWRESVAAFERQNAHLAAHALVRAWLDNYAPGGPFNTAVTDHMRTHLEDYKVADANALLEQLGWEPFEQPQEYQVRVRIERPVTTYEYGYAYVSVMATDEESAIEQVADTYRARDLADYVSDWETNWDGADVDTYSVEADFDDAEVV